MKQKEESNTKLIALSRKLLACLKDILMTLACGNQNGIFGPCKYFQKDEWTCSKKGMCVAKKWLNTIRKS